MATGASQQLSMDQQAFLSQRPALDTNTTNISSPVGPRRVWFRLAGKESSLTSVFVSSNDLIDDLKTSIFNRYPHTLGPNVDPSDIIIKSNLPCFIEPQSSLSQQDGQQQQSQQQIYHEFAPDDLVFDILNRIYSADSNNNGSAATMKTKDAFLVEVPRLPTNGFNNPQEITFPVNGSRNSITLNHIEPHLVQESVNLPQSPFSAEFNLSQADNTIEIAPVSSDNNTPIDRRQKSAPKKPKLNLSTSSSNHDMQDIPLSSSSVTGGSSESSHSINEHQQPRNHQKSPVNSTAASKIPVNQSRKGPSANGSINTQHPRQNSEQYSDHQKKGSNGVILLPTGFKAQAGPPSGKKVVDISQQIYQKKHSSYGDTDYSGPSNRQEHPNSNNHFKKSKNGSLNSNKPLPQPPILSNPQRSTNNYSQDLNPDYNPNHTSSNGSKRNQANGSTRRAINGSSSKQPTPSRNSPQQQNSRQSESPRLLPQGVDTIANESPVPPSESTSALDETGIQPQNNSDKRNSNMLISLTQGPEVVPQVNVLIVEDNVINMKILERFLRQKKIRCDWAKNGREAIEKWRQGGFHLVLMDIQMPELSGVEATKEIRRLEQVNRIGVFSNSATAEKENEYEDNNNNNETASSTSPSKSPAKPSKPIPECDLLDNKLFKFPVIIVALTASSTLEDRTEALAAGCNDYLVKPVNLKWLLQKTIEWGCMQALIDFDGWKYWVSKPPPSISNGDKDKDSFSRSFKSKPQSTNTRNGSIKGKGKPSAPLLSSSNSGNSTTTTTTPNADSPMRPRINASPKLRGLSSSIPNSPNVPSNLSSPTTRVSNQDKQALFQVATTSTNTTPALGSSSPSSSNSASPLNRGYSSVVDSNGQASTPPSIPLDAGPLPYTMSPVRSSTPVLSTGVMINGTDKKRQIN